MSIKLSINKLLSSVYNATLFSLTGFAPIAFADLGHLHISHQRNLLPGDRAALLGGAYTALSEDPSGLYYNPSGLAFAEKPEISMNVLFSEFTTSLTYEEAINGFDFEERSKTNFSNISGGMFKKGSFTFAYSFMSLDNRNINQTDKFENISDEPDGFASFNRIHQESNNYNLMGAGVSTKLGKYMSIGVSGFYYKRTIESMDYQLVRRNNENLAIFTTKIKTSNEGILPIFGATFRGQSLSLGVSFRKGINFSDHSEVSVENTAYDHSEAVNDIPPETIGLSATTKLFEEPNPETIAVGLAWFPSKMFLISGDVLLHRGKEMPNGLSDLKNTINASLGMELKLGFLRLACGVFTNNSLFPEVDGSNPNNITYVDYIGGSAGISITSKALELTLGAVFQEGEGEANIITGSSDIQDVRSDSSMLFISAKYKF